MSDKPLHVRVAEALGCKPEDSHAFRRALGRRRDAVHRSWRCRIGFHDWDWELERYRFCKDCRIEQELLRTHLGSIWITRSKFVAHVGYVKTRRSE